MKQLVFYFSPFDWRFETVYDINYRQYQIGPFGFNWGDNS